MRIAIYSHNYWPEPTGIPYYNTSLCRWLAQRVGWQVTMRTGMPHYPWWRVPEAYANRDYRQGRADERVDGVAIERVRHFVPTPPPSCLGRMRLDVSWLAAVAWRSLWTKSRPDAVVLIAPPFLIGLLGLWLRLRWRVPVVYHVQDLQVDAAIELGMMPPILARVLLATERLILSNVDLVTTISPAMRQQLLAKTNGRRNVEMFPNWVDGQAMCPWPGANRFRRAWNLPAEAMVAMYAGNLGRKQGLEVLIAAAALLPPTVSVVIAGAGGERVELERLAASLAPGRIRFCDLVDAADLAEFLSAGDIHCVVQRAVVAGAVMPSKLLNIMAVARPMVVTAQAGTDLAEAVQAAAAGIVVPPDDAAALAAAIAELAADPARRAAAGTSARAWVLHAFGIDRVLARFAARLCQLSARIRTSAPRSTTRRAQVIQGSPLSSSATLSQHIEPEATLAMSVVSDVVNTAPMVTPQVIPIVPFTIVKRAELGVLAVSSAPGASISKDRQRAGATRTAKVTSTASSKQPVAKP